MKNIYSAQQKQAILNRYHSGISVRELVIEAGVPRSTIYAWLKRARKQMKSIPSAKKHTTSFRSMFAVCRKCCTS